MLCPKENRSYLTDVVNCILSGVHKPFGRVAIVHTAHHLRNECVHKGANCATTCVHKELRG